MGIDLTNEQVYCIYSLENWWKSKDKQVFEISGAAGTGKALSNDTFIPTVTGEKKISDIKVGDYVFNRHGKPTKVLGVYPQGKIKAYRVRFDDGSFVDCNEEHIWPYLKEVKPIGYVIKTTELKNIISDSASSNIIYRIPLNDAVEFDSKNEIFPEDIKTFDFYNYGKFLSKKISDKNFSIPAYLTYVSIDSRWKFIKGICQENARYGNDTLGTVTLSSKNINSLLSIKYILSSLGIKSIISNFSKLYEERFIKSNYLFLQILPTKSKLYNFVNENEKNKSKLDEIYSSNEFKECNSLNIAAIEEIPDKEMTCIYVDDPEHLFLCGPFIPTHNTTIVKYFIERLGLTFNNVLFMCYMGKAATQLARNGVPAKTIHSSIYDYEEKVVRNEKGYIEFNDDGKIKVKKDFVLKHTLGKKIKLIVIDEASMVNEKIAKDILSFNIPVVALGDLNQLPPVFGNPYFLLTPDVTLHQVMRQAEGSPIIYLAQKVLNNEDLKVGVYGASFVIPKTDVTDFHFKKADIVITGTNRLRNNINDYYRENLKGIKQLDYPHINEKVICCKNNWDMCLDKTIYMTNGTTGFVDYIYKDSYNKRTMQMDFRPDYTKKVFRHVEFDYHHMFNNESESSSYNYFYDKFEFAYAVTCHKVQGSQYPYVLYMHEDFMKSEEDRRKLLYTAITRASETIGVVI